MNNQFPSAPTLQDEDTNQIGKKQKGTGFTNISRILKANVGAGERMGSQIGAGIGSRAKSLQQQTQAGAQQFRGQYGQARGKALEDIGKVGSVAGQIEDTGYVAPVTPAPAAQVAAQTPPNASVAQPQVAPVSTPTPVSNITDITGEQATQLGEAFRQAQYGGPRGISGGGELSAQAAGLSKFSDYASRGGFGRQNLLRSMASGQTPYTKGQSLLDATLLGQDVAGQRSIAQAAQQARQAATETGQQLGIAEQLAETAKEQIEAEKEKVGTSVTEKIGAIEKFGKESAIAFKGEAEKLKSLLTGAEKIVTEEEAASSPEKAKKREEQISLLSNLSQYGIDPTSEVYATDEAALNNALNSIFNTGSTTPSGDTRFSDAQRKALEVLSGITKDKKVAERAKVKMEMPWDVGKDDIGKIAASQASKIASEEDKAKRLLQFGQEFRPIMESILNKSNTAQIVALNPFLAPFLLPFQNREEEIWAKEAAAFDALSKKYGFSPQEAADIAQWSKTKMGVADELIRRGSSSLTQAQQKAASKTTLQDYLKKRFGIK